MGIRNDGNTQMLLNPNNFYNQNQNLDEIESEQSIFISLISKCVRNQRPLTKAGLRTITSKGTVEECVEILVELGFRFLAFVFQNSDIYQIMGRIGAQDRGPGFLETAYFENYDKEIQN